MAKLEVLVATMHQKDFSLIEKMNIKCDAVFANQTDVNTYDEVNTGEFKAKMISTTTKGVGVNRNIALCYSQGDILLLSDDDFIYNDDMPQKVLQAFEELPQADVIIFGSHFTLNGEIYETTRCKTAKLPIHKSMKYGTYAVAVRKKSLKTTHVSFLETFGGGCEYGHGEDSDFILHCYRERLKVYTYDYILGSTAKDTSTWFTGYDDKYYYDGGAWAKSSLGIFSFAYMLYITLRTSKLSDLSASRKIKNMVAGYKNYKKLITYKEWKEITKN